MIPNHPAIARNQRIQAVALLCSLIFLLIGEAHAQTSGGKFFAYTEYRAKRSDTNAKPCPPNVEKGTYQTTIFFQKAPDPQQTQNEWDYKTFEIDTTVQPVKLDQNKTIYTNDELSRLLNIGTTGRETPTSIDGFLKKVIDHVCNNNIAIARMANIAASTIDSSKKLTKDFIGNDINNKKIIPENDMNIIYILYALVVSSIILSLLAIGAMAFLHQRLGIFGKFDKRNKGLVPDGNVTENSNDLVTNTDAQNNQPWMERLENYRDWIAQDIENIRHELTGNINELTQSITDKLRRHDKRLKALETDLKKSMAYSREPASSQTSNEPGNEPMVAASHGVVPMAAVNLPSQQPTPYASPPQIGTPEMPRIPEPVKKLLSARDWEELRALNVPLSEDARKQLGRDRSAAEIGRSLVVDVLPVNQSAAYYQRISDWLRAFSGDSVELLVPMINGQFDETRHRMVDKEAVDKGRLNHITRIVRPGLIEQTRVLRKAEVVLST